jgi:peptidoglycan/xylan/chitin deacetylase (PgdA/CDA1 family)
VLIYHRVGGGSGLEIDLSPALFEEQMSALAEAANVISLDAAIELLAGGDEPEGDPVVVTFDDGTRDFADHAVPILERHGVPATLYVATDFIEQGRAFPHDGAALSWSALADAHATGLITVGSHTHTHALLDRADAQAVVDELDRSIGLIHDRLGVAADHFAYPKGLGASGPAEAEVRRRFLSAAVGGGQPNRYGATDVHRLQRTPIQVLDGMRWFRAKAAGGMALEGALRRVLDRGRYVGASS